VEISFGAHDTAVATNMNAPKLLRAKEIQKSIRDILYHHWDPIGVRGLGPEDEYDAYIGTVYQILATSRSEQELINYLDQTERITIGLSGNQHDRLERVAQKLLSLDVRLDANT
jgi:hypothetical protein